MILSHIKKGKKRHKNQGKYSKTATFPTEKSKSPK
nr:MAG TPA: hypothetical protein [Caudoviricetes sp.]